MLVLVLLLLPLLLRLSLLLLLLFLLVIEGLLKHQGDMWSAPDHILPTGRDETPVCTVKEP